MKSILFSAALLIGPQAAHADIFVVTDDENGIPRVATPAVPALSDIPEIAGQANEGFRYGQLWAGLDGYHLFEGRVAPGGRIASHDGPDIYVAYIVSGHGTMGNDAPDGSLASQVSFGPGDFIVFGPGTMHHWVNGDKELVFIGFQRLPSDGD